MKVSLDSSSANTIIAYDVGMVRVHARADAKQQAATASVQIRQLTESCIITPTTLIEDWAAQTARDLTQDHLAAILALEPEIVILGSGRYVEFPPSEIIAACHTGGAGFEVMDTGAACRTYNILAGEGRRVAAALLMIDSPQ